MKIKPHIRFRYGRWECGIKDSCYDFVGGETPLTAYINWEYKYTHSQLRCILKKHVDNYKKT